MGLHVVVLNKADDIKEGLFEFIKSFDSDFSGENGEQYVCKEAKEQGYNSDMEYSYAQGVMKCGNYTDVVKKVMSDLEDTYFNYAFCDCEVVDTMDKIIVAFTYFDN